MVKVWSRVLPLCLIVGACSGETSDEAGSDGEGDGAIGNDGGLVDGGDGLDAGGDGGDGASDAGGLDGGLDAGEGDAGSGDGGAAGLVVSVRQGGQPVPGQRVALYASVTGEPQLFTTDEAGDVVIAEAQPIVTVTPAFELPTVTARGYPVTYLGVEDGDHLIVEYAGDDLGNALGSFAVSFTSASEGAADYIVRSGANCSASTVDALAGATVAMYSGCLGGTNPVLAIANGEGGPQACAFATDNPAPSPGSVQGVTLPAFDPVETATVSVTNLPDVGGLELTSRLDMLSSTQRYFSDQSGGSLFEGGDLYPVCPGFPEALDASVLGFLGDSEFTLAERAADTTSFVFDLGTTLPLVESMQLDTEATTPQVTVTLVSSPSGADAGLFELGFLVPSTETTEFVPWLVVVPPETTTIELPPIPELLAEGTLTLGSAGYVELGSVTDYDAFRQRALKLNDYTQPIDIRREPVKLEMEGTADTLRTVSYVPPGG